VAKQIGKETEMPWERGLNFALSHHTFPREGMTQRKSEIIKTLGFVSKYTLIQWNAKIQRENKSGMNHR
jgi:hypothetical protein